VAGVQPLKRLWPAPTKAEHVDHSSLKKQHTRAFRLANAAIEERNKRNGTKEREIKPWVLYSFRHTFLTRLVSPAVTSGRLQGSLGTLQSRIQVATSTLQRTQYQTLCRASVGTILGTAKIKLTFCRWSNCRKRLKRKPKDGAPGEVRTPDLTLRRRSLYPAELRARNLRIHQESPRRRRAHSPSRASLKELRRFS
jgi:hypothetical protein